MTRPSPGSESSRAASAPADGTTRRRGRPRREIDKEEVADVVERLFAEHGYHGVSIERTAEELSVSRATLYRTVPSKEHLLAILFERMTTELLTAALLIAEDEDSTPRERILRLMHAQIEAAVRQRDYLFVFFGGGWLPPEFYAGWRRWRRDYEQVWERLVKEAIESGDIDGEDPVVITRLLTGMTTWVARWYRPEERYTASEIADIAVHLVLQSRT
jgi:AcrR family transcriptional regulator